MQKILLDYLKEKGYDFNNDKSSGILLECLDKEIVIKGSKIDLIELADYIINVALSNIEIDHIHIDDLSLINVDSPVRNLIVEKE